MMPEITQQSRRRNFGRRNSIPNTMSIALVPKCVPAFRKRVVSGCAGFTLVELIIVIVVMSILALGTTRYIVQTTEQYTASADRTKLIGSGRVAVEKIVRRLRNALPNSVRVSASGRCVEFFPILAGTASVGVIPRPVNSLATATFSLASAPTNYAVIAPLTSGELYNPSPGDRVIRQTTISSAGTYSSIDLGAPVNFLRTSPTERVYLVGQPQRFCASANALTHFSDYGILASLSDLPPAGALVSLIAEDVDISLPDLNFQYTPGTLKRNAIVAVTLNFLKSGDPVRIFHEVQIRNVP